MIQKYKPEIDKRWLLLIAGMMWSGVGVLLNLIALKWIKTFNLSESLFSFTGGPLLGFMIAWFGFKKIVYKNINRIKSYPQRVCLFAFQEWRIYILIIVMMSLGVFLRSTSFIPKIILAPAYIGIGIALFFSSFLYYMVLYKNLEK